MYNKDKEWNHSEHTDEWLKDRLQLCEKPQGESGIELGQSMNEEHSKLVSWALDNYPLSTSHGQKALDIGCGGGATIKAINKRYQKLELYGIDYSKDMVNLATSLLGNSAKITEGSVTNLPYQDNEFDLITAVETMYFWPDIVNSLKNVYKTLKDTGKFIIIHEMYDDNEDMTYKDRNLRIAKLSNLQLFTAEALKSNLIKAGFTKIEYSTIPENNWISYLVKK